MSETPPNDPSDRAHVNGHPSGRAAQVDLPLARLRPMRLQHRLPNPGEQDGGSPPKGPRGSVGGVMRLSRRLAWGTWVGALVLIGIWALVGATSAVVLLVAHLFESIGQLLEAAGKLVLSGIAWLPGALFNHPLPSLLGLLGGGCVVGTLLWPVVLPWLRDIMGRRRPASGGTVSAGPSTHRLDEVNGRPPADGPAGPSEGGRHLGDAERWIAASKPEPAAAVNGGWRARLAQFAGGAAAGVPGAEAVRRAPIDRQLVVVLGGLALAGAVAAGISFSSFGVRSSRPQIVRPPQAEEERPASRPATQPGAARTAPPTRGGGKMATIELEKGGRIVVQLDSQTTPRAAQNFIQKATAGFYDGLTFHRVEDWVVQGGDPRGDGSGGGNMPSELNDQPFVAGAVGVARGQDIRINNDAQFFICLKACEWLNKEHTNFGQVTAGLDVAQTIRPGDRIRRITISG